MAPRACLAPKAQLQLQPGASPQVAGTGRPSALKARFNTLMVGDAFPHTDGVKRTFSAHIHEMAWNPGAMPQAWS